MFISGLFEKAAKRLVIFTVLLCCFGVSTASRSFYAQETGRSNDQQTQTFLAVFDDVWSTISERYYDPAFNGVDWSALRGQYRSLAAKARDEKTLYSVIKTMLLRLNDVHTRV